MSIRPLHDRVVVKRIETEEKTRGGIIIPDTAKEKPQEGEVDRRRPRQAQRRRQARRRWTSRRATGSCSASTPAPRSRSTATSYLILREDEILAVLEK